MRGDTLEDRISSAASLEELREICLDPAGNGAWSDGAVVGRALHRHLVRRTGHPRYRQWVDVYLGGAPASYRSSLQQPDFLYYPGLPPVAWFETAAIPAMARLRGQIPQVREELRAWMTDRAMRPYVRSEAEGDVRWSGLAGRADWSSIHLLGGADPESSPIAELPVTRGFLDAAPLAPFPPHAPECFVSRLAPGVVLPEHFGLSNIKLTVHLPVDIPREGCSITVAGTTRTWPDDDFLVFDDSFLHTAANRSRHARTVLILDIAHPMLDPDEVAGLAYAIQALHFVRLALARRSEQAGEPDFRGG